MTKNKFSKYLLYAIGEIILVVIGILIALKINTISQQKTNRDYIESILKSVYFNLESDMSNPTLNEKESIQTSMKSGEFVGAK